MNNDAAVAVLSPSGKLAFACFSQPARLLYPDGMISTPKLSVVETSLMDERLKMVSIELEI
jgi:hypothetical protein